MMLTRGLLAVSLLMSPLADAAAHSQPLEHWRCAVEDFSTLEEGDVAFVKANMRKKFFLTVTKSDILVKMTSTDFEGREHRYPFSYSDRYIRAGSLPTTMAIDTVILPLRPEKNIEADGYFNATIVGQGSSYANVWKLRCAE